MMNYNSLLSNVIASVVNNPLPEIDGSELLLITDFRSHEFYLNYVDKFSTTISNLIKPRYATFFNMEEFVKLWAGSAMNLYEVDGEIYLDQDQIPNLNKVEQTLACIEKMCYSELMMTATEFFRAILIDYFNTKEEPLFAEMIKYRIPYWEQLTNETISKLNISEE